MGPSIGFEVPSSYNFDECTNSFESEAKIQFTLNPSIEKISAKSLVLSVIGGGKGQFNFYGSHRKKNNTSTINLGIDFSYDISGRIATPFWEKTFRQSDAIKIVEGSWSI